MHVDDTMGCRKIHGKTTTHLDKFIMIKIDFEAIQVCQSLNVLLMHFGECFSKKTGFHKSC